jgi:hypothetical protein
VANNKKIIYNQIMKYKNVSGFDLTIPEIGIVKANATIETEEINNPNFVKVEEKKVEKTIINRGKAKK